MDRDDSFPRAAEELAFWNGNRWVPYWTPSSRRAPCQCHRHPKHEAFALWVGWSRTYLCKEALDAWLDNADDDESLEPKELVF